MSSQDTHFLMWICKKPIRVAPALLTSSRQLTASSLSVSWRVLFDQCCGNSCSQIPNFFDSTFYLCRHPVQQPHHGPLHLQSPSSSAISTYSNLTNNQTGLAFLASYFQAAKRPRPSESRVWNGCCINYSYCGIPTRRRMLVKPPLAPLRFYLSVVYLLPTRNFVRSSHL